ncbi:MAG: hypothetical protein V7772_17320 [Pseudomonas profundi]|uniref:hypothetical protein n=1 Tax=Pseudomonas profundi TaxID=1981513 RepID=UPI003002BF84
MQRQCLSSGCMFLLMLGWSLLPGPMQDWIMLPLWIVCTVLIFTGSFEAARLRRRVWLNQYLRVASPWHRLLRGGAFMAAWHLLVGALLSLFMLIKLQNLNAALWAVLALGLPLLAWLSRGLNRRMREHVVSQALPALVRRFSVPLAVGVLTAIYLVVTLNLGQPDLRGLSWGSAMAQHMQPSTSDLTVLRVLERSYIMLDLTLQWALQNGLGGAERNGWLALAGWSLLFLTGSAFIWAYVRLLVGVDALVDQRREPS